MAAAQFQPCLDFTLKEEGGYQCNPRDAGNWTGGEIGVGRLIGTNMGIAAPTLLAWLGRAHSINASKVFMQNLPLATASAIYAAYFWRAVAGDALPVGVNLMVFDFGVTSGPGRSAKILQGILGVSVDGDIGPKTLAAAAKFDPAGLVSTIVARQESHYRALPTFPEFGAGWISRTARRQSTAMGMINAAS